MTSDLWRIYMPHSMEPATVASFLTEQQAHEQIEAWKRRQAKGGRPDLVHIDLDALEVRPRDQRDGERA